jgi:hypothetical protein
VVLVLDDGLKIRLLWEELQDDGGLNGECAYSLSKGSLATCLPMEVERTVEEMVVEVARVVGEGEREVQGKMKLFDDDISIYLINKQMFVDTLEMKLPNSNQGQLN